MESLEEIEQKLEEQKAEMAKLRTTLRVAKEEKSLIGLKRKINGIYLNIKTTKGMNLEEKTMAFINETTKLFKDFE
jgi:hypothetical protein